VALHGTIFFMVSDFERNNEQTSSFSKTDMLHPTDPSWHCMLPDGAYQILMQQVNVDCKQGKAGVRAVNLHVFAQLHALG